MTDRIARWGLLSTARINERLIPCLGRSERNELIGVASRSRATADRYAREHGIYKAYGSYEEMLADPAIDVVYVSLPNGLHTKWSLRCAEAGKHVLCEKPLALSVAEVDQLREAADRCGVTIQEATMMRFHSQTFYVRNLIAEGVIGEVRMGRGLFTFTLHRPGDIRLDPAMGGGSIWDLGSYCVSFARTILQAEPVEVAAKLGDGVDRSAKPAVVGIGQSVRVEA
jgi:predicted dehydrogenase